MKAKQKLYVFLDCDGVLNCSDLFEKQFNENISLEDLWVDLDQNCIKALKDLEDILINFYDVKIILSSTWRMVPNRKRNLDIVFELTNLIPIHDCTIKCNTNREDEIRQYLTANNISEKNILILDDEEVGKLNHRLIQTDFYKKGLDEQAIYRALELLNIRIVNI